MVGQVKKVNEVNVRSGEIRVTKGGSGDRQSSAVPLGVVIVRLVDFSDEVLAQSFGHWCDAAIPSEVVKRGG